MVCGLGIVAVARTQEDARNGLPRLSTLHHIRETLVSWDGYWYLELAKNGYPSVVPPDVTYFMVEARAAFFPIFPLIVRWTDAALPGGLADAALIANFILGAAAVLAIGALTHRLYGEHIAIVAMVVFAMFPGSFVLSMAYSEAIMITCSALALRWLINERWLLAGIAGAIATATRPNALALVLACLAAVWMHRSQRRNLAGAALAGALTAAGFLATQLFISQTAHEGGVWFRIQREAWSEGLSFGIDTLRLVGEWVSSPLGSPTRALTAASTVIIVVGLWSMRKARLHPIVSWYTIGVVGLMVSASTTTPRPRFLLTAFGLLIAISAYWTQRSPRSRDASRVIELVVAGCCGAALVTVTAIYGLLGAIP